MPAELVPLEETDDATEGIEALTEGLDDKKRGRELHRAWRSWFEGAIGIQARRMS